MLAGITEHAESDAGAAYLRTGEQSRGRMNWRNEHIETCTMSTSPKLKTWLAVQDVEACQNGHANVVYLRIEKVRCPRGDRAWPIDLLKYVSSPMDARHQKKTIDVVCLFPIAASASFAKNGAFGYPKCNLKLKSHGFCRHPKHHFFNSVASSQYVP